MRCFISRFKLECFTVASLHLFAVVTVSLCNEFNKLTKIKKLSTFPNNVVQSTSLTSCILMCQRQDLSAVFDSNMCFCVTDKINPEICKEDDESTCQIFAKRDPCPKSSCFTGTCLTWSKAKERICRDNEGFELQKSFVCFEARGDKYGEFELQRSGILTDLKLVHANGSNTCNKDNITPTYFGCLNNVNLISVIISDKYKKILFPAFQPDAYGFYSLSGYRADSKFIIFTGYELSVKENFKLRLWYGEDFFNAAEQNNAGRTCVHIYVKYS